MDEVEFALAVGLLGLWQLPDRDELETVRCSVLLLREAQEDAPPDADPVWAGHVRDALAAADEIEAALAGRTGDPVGAPQRFMAAVSALWARTTAGLSLASVSEAPGAPSLPS
jgi:hypothetical protein